MVFKVPSNPDPMTLSLGIRKKGKCFVKLHPGVAQVGYWKVSGLLAVLTLVVIAWLTWKKGGNPQQFCCRSYRIVESWGTFIRLSEDSENFKGLCLCPAVSLC